MKLFPHELADKRVLPIWYWLDGVEDILADQNCLEIFPTVTHLLDSTMLESFVVLYGVIKAKLELHPSSSFSAYGTRSMWSTKKVKCHHPSTPHIDGNFLTAFLGASGNPRASTSVMMYLSLGIVFWVLGFRVDVLPLVVADVGSPS